MKKLSIAVAVAAAAFSLPALAQQQGGDQAKQQQEAQAGGMQSNASPSTLREVQKALNDKGYDAGNVDGLWGPHTQGAVKNFQEAQGAEATGQLDRETLSALGVTPGGGEQAQQGSGGSQQQGSQSSGGSGSQSQSKQG